MLAACGDGSSYLAEGGITGSGISVGPITGFGSVWSGGIRYDTRQTEFYRNGQWVPEGQAAFQVGEIVSITGTINADGSTGIAERIEFDRKLSGPVTRIAATSNSIESSDKQWSRMH
ncbi:MAG: hypothetical protein R3E95_06470 [Thiolinea sp.]